MAKKQKNFYYVVLIGENRELRFVTKCDTDTRVAEWNATEKPYKFYSWEDANYVAMGLTWHGTYAFPVVNNYEIEPIYKEAENG